MNFTLRSSSSSFNENERLTRKRQPPSTTTTTSSSLNRFLSFNENKSSSVENRRRLLQPTPNLIELLEEDEDILDDTQALCHECNTCSKIFASEYGLNHHINMYHPNQSILCSLCNITFRSHRSLKTHQQRRHSTIQTKILSNHSLLPNYSYLSSYLVQAFSSKKFPLVAKIACEQQKLPLGYLTSKIYQCHLCLISFPCSRTLKYHLIDKHEQYEYKICETILSEIIIQVEFNLRTVNDNDDDDDIESIKYILAKQSSQFGLINKELSKKLSSTKKQQNHLIHPICQHKNRTCANLCLEYLSSYSKLIKNYPYTISTISKGNPFIQGPIVSIMSSMNNIYSNGLLSMNDSNISNDQSSNGRQKRKNLKQIDDSSSSSSSPTSQLKKKILSNITTTNTKINRTNSNNKLTIGKQPIEQTSKINETKIVSIEQSSFSLSVTTSSNVPRKILPKDNYMRSSSISSNSSTSTRSSTIKSSSSSTNLTQRTSKRSLSPSIVISLEKSAQKRRRSREPSKQKLNSSSSTAIIRIDDDDDENNIEQENDDDDNDDDDIIPIKFEQSKQRQASSGSIEYVQTLDNEQQLTSSLNNIENLKSKSKINDEEIIICRSPPSVKKVISSNKNHSKTSINGTTTKKTNIQQSPNKDEHVRVRCKICGDILEGRSRFSQHVITMHSHLLKKNINESKQQQQIAIVR